MRKTIISSPDLVTWDIPTDMRQVASLFQALNRAGVRYCHWKSNVHLEQALSGKTDLDLLVDREHGELFRSVLNEHHIKPLVAAPGKHYPGIDNYLGYDPGSGKLFHLHVHYQLILGEQFVKNYRLPVEKQFLDSARPDQGVKVPAPELELIILSLRALLKYRDRDVIKDMFSIRTPGLPAAIRQEINWLMAQTNRASLEVALQTLGDIVPADVVRGFLDTVVDQPRAGYTLFRLRERVRQALRPYQRQDRFWAALHYCRELWRRRKRIRSRPPQKMSPVGGGQTIALVGADGAGKSTTRQILYQWLAWKFDTHVFYLGSQEPTRRSITLYLLFRMARRSQRECSRLLGDQRLPSRWLAGLRETILKCHHISIAYDRYYRCRTGRQLAARGSMVIFDRFPLEAPLDGPRIAHPAKGSTALENFLYRWEQDIYRQNSWPDFFLLMDVHPDVSLHRKPDHDPKAIEAKHNFLRQFAARETGRHLIAIIDANRPLDVVVAQLKEAMWPQL